jgi:iron complex transport system substrate-binding protein
MIFNRYPVSCLFTDFAAVSIMLLSLTACNNSTSIDKTSDEAEISYKAENANRFILNKTDSCMILTILDPWQGSTSMKTDYYLLEHGAIASGFPSEKIIYIPVKRIICTSTTHLAMINALGEERALCGFSGIRYIYDDGLRNMAREGMIGEIGYDSGLDFEQIVSLKPDLMMVYGINGENAVHTGKLEELGIKVMYNADYLENDPLAKAEWIKVFGALFCKDQKADSIYMEISDAYKALKDTISNFTEKRPKVLLGLPFRDSWFISSGNSFVSHLIHDAGGNYVWSDVKTDKTLPFGIESVWIKALDADFWLNTGSATTAEDIRTIDQRLASLPCFINGNIYNNNKRIAPGGGNDYWESGILKPHIILKDIATILNPEIFKDYTLFYYRKIDTISN